MSNLRNYNGEIVPREAKENVAGCTEVLASSRRKGGRRTCEASEGLRESQLPAAACSTVAADPAGQIPIGILCNSCPVQNSKPDETCKEGEKDILTETIDNRISSNSCDKFRQSHYTRHFLVDTIGLKPVTSTGRDNVSKIIEDYEKYKTLVQHSSRYQTTKLVLSKENPFFEKEWVNRKLLNHLPAVKSREVDEVPRHMRPAFENLRLSKSVNHFPLLRALQNS